MIASAGGQDRLIKIWRPQPNNKWELEFFDEAESPVNCIAWAPWEYGTILAAGTADGKIYSYERLTNGEGHSWKKRVEQAHPKPDKPILGRGVKSLVWGPSGVFQSPQDNLMLDKVVQDLLPLRFVTLSQDDQTFKYWEFSDGDYLNRETVKVEEAKGSWVTDIAWNSSVGSITQTLAVSTQNNTVVIYKIDQGKWNKTKSFDTNLPAWKLNWSPSGDLLAVSCGEDQIRVYKENVNGEWNLQ